MSLRTKQFLLTSAATMAITIALATPSSARANDANEVIGQPVVGRLATAAPSGQKAPAFLGTDNDAPAAEATAARTCAPRAHEAGGSAARTCSAPRAYEVSHPARVLRRLIAPVGSGVQWCPVPVVSSGAVSSGVQCF